MALQLETLAVHLEKGSDLHRMFEEYRERVRVYGGSKRKMSRAAAVRALLRFALLSKGCKGKLRHAVGAISPQRQLGLFR